MNKRKIATLILIIIWMILVFYLSQQSADKSSMLSGGVLKSILKVFNLLEGTSIITFYALCFRRNFNTITY